MSRAAVTGLRWPFPDGTEGERDFTDMVAEEMVEPLRDPAFFTRALLDGATLTLPNGFDLDSIALHAEMKEQRPVMSQAS